MTKKKNDNVFLDDEVIEVEGGEEKGKFEGDFFFRIVAAEIDTHYTSKSTGKTQLNVNLTFKVVPNIDDRGWAGQQKKVFLYGNAQWKLDEVFKAIDLPYVPHETKTYKNSEPVKKWQLSQKNLIGRGCTIDMFKPKGAKYSEPESFTIIDGLKVCTQDELMELFPVDHANNGESDLPF